MTKANEINVKQIIESTIKDSIKDAIKNKLSGYNSPFDNLLIEVFATHEEKIRVLVNNALSKIIEEKEFKNSIVDAFRHKLSRGLVESLSGTVDRAANALKSDPRIKAKMVIAIEKVVNECYGGKHGC